MGQQPNFNYNDPSFDPTRSTIAPDPAHIRRAQRNAVASAMHAANPSEHKAHLRAIGDHLHAIENAMSDMAVGAVKSNTGPNATQAQREYAANVINSNHALAGREADAARERLAQLTQSALASVAPAVDANSIEVESRKQDLIAALQAAGPRRAQAEALGLLNEAMQNGDQITIGVLLGAPLSVRASVLGISQQALRLAYVERVFDSEGAHPLMGSALPDPDMLRAISDGTIANAIAQHESDAQSTLVQLARDAGLSA